jgi:hypothetical protein
MQIGDEGVKAIFFPRNKNGMEFRDGLFVYFKDILPFSHFVEE